MCPETIRWRAFECMQFAQNSRDPQHRAVLLELARSWAGLANAVERYQQFAEAAEGKLVNGADPKGKARQTNRLRSRIRPPDRTSRSPYVHAKRSPERLAGKRRRAGGGS
jgi:hypothetical protein